MLAELEASGQSAIGFARSKGVSIQRIVYWKKQLSTPTGPTPEFVAVPLPSTPSVTNATSETRAGAEIEIVVDGISVRVREGHDVEQVARLVGALARRTR